MNRFNCFIKLHVACRRIEKINKFSLNITKITAYLAKGAIQFFVNPERPGEPSDIAAGIEFLATQPYVNGITLPIDGGFLC